MDAILLFELLEREFCPPLDTSLLAALLADLDLTGSGDDADAQVSTLRMQLAELAVHADEESSQELEFDDFDGTSSSARDFCTTTTTTTTTTSMSDNIVMSGGALRFLRAALPDLPVERLAKALSDVDAADEELDMWGIISTILSEETEREMRERDLDESEMKEMDTKMQEAAWETVESSHKRAPRKPAKKKTTTTKTKITISDVRQQQHARAGASRPRVRVDDPWAQLTSLSTHVAHFLPPHPPSFFQSYFHSPDHARTPYAALCAALGALCPASSPASSQMEDAAYTTTLFNLLDLLLSSYSSSSDESRSRLIADIELALSAAQGRGEDAFELVKVLRDLDEDAKEGVYEMGVYHSPATTPAATSERLPAPAAKVLLPTGPAPTPPPPPLLLTQDRKAASTPGKPHGPHQWQAVPMRRRPPPRADHPHAMHIPAYATNVSGVRVRRSGGGGKGGKADGDAYAHRRRVGESVRKRDEMLREAARMWQRGRGDRKGRGGEVAFYFAERAREFQEAAKREALDAARIMVETKRFSDRDRDTVDLHGVTAAEAVVIVNEILSEKTWSSEKPLKIITGRGAHSANQVSVLKPAVKKALTEDGWIVGVWDGGLTVRGKRNGLR